ncbi:MAG: mevalonate kinase [Halobacteriales archaeon]
MPTSSAPGKVYLFGEHAVVYGEPAVPCAIERRARATVERRDDGRVTLDAPALSFDGVTVEYGAGDPALSAEPDRVRRAVRYVDAALASAREVAGDDRAGFDVTIESDLPIGAGLGSSAAVTVAALDAAARACDVELDRETLADRAYRVEYEAQDGRASRADTFCAATGGAVRVEGDDCRAIEAPALPFVVGYDGGSGDTGELVADVRALADDYGFVGDTIAAIGDLVRRGEAVLADGDLDELGRLMDVNHGLLAALGVSGRSLDDMVWTAREAGASGAKLTGAGGAGCVVALDPTDGTEQALGHAPACEMAFRAGLAETGLKRR